MKDKKTGVMGCSMVLLWIVLFWMMFGAAAEARSYKILFELVVLIATCAIPFLWSEFTAHSKMEDKTIINAMVYFIGCILSFVIGHYIPFE